MVGSDRIPSKRALGVALILMALLAAGVAAAGGKADDKKALAKVLPLSGTVDPGMAAHVKRALAEEEGSSSTLFIIELDTFGGRVDSALAIVDSLLALPPERTIA